MSAMPREDGDRAAPTARRATPATVVVVEDEPVVRELVVTTLEATDGFQAAAGDLDRWVTATTEAQPDVVLVDLRLGSQDAVEQLPHIVRRCPRTMVAALTGLPAEQEEARARDAGAFVFYEKTLLSRLPALLEEDLERFHQALAGEDVVAPLAVTRRRTAPR